MRFFIIYIIASIFTMSIGAQTHSSVIFKDSLKYNFVRNWGVIKPESNPGQLHSGVDVNVARILTEYSDELGRNIQTVLKKGSLITNPADPESAANAADWVQTVTYDHLGRKQYQYLPARAITTGITSNINDGSFKRDPFTQIESFYTSGDAVINPLYNQSESDFYVYTRFDNSAFNIALESFAPGKNWAGTKDSANESARHSVRLILATNTVTDSVRIWNVTDAANDTGWATYHSPGYYPPGALNKHIDINENGNQVILYYDEQNNLILKKTQITAENDAGTGSGYQGWACTYYLYDDLNRQRAVIQPVGVAAIKPGFNLTTEIINEQMFRYEFDAYGRPVKRKAPGTEPEYYVYDSKNRMVMYQDGNLRNEHPDKWIVTLYDALNREAEKGIYQFSGSNNFYYHIQQANASAAAYPFATAPSTGWISLIRYGYDRYTGMPSVAGLTSSYDNSFNTHLLAASSTVFPYPQTPVQKNTVKGLATWKQVRILNTDQWITEVYIYDNDDRLIQVKRANELGGIDIVTAQYSWGGLILRNVFRSAKDGVTANQTVWVTKNTLDELGRIVKIDKQFITNIPEVAGKDVSKTISKFYYDAQGNVKEKHLGNDPKNAGNPLEKQVYDYNVRGWLIGLNRAELEANKNNNGSFWAFELGYDKVENSSNRNFSGTQFNGNVAAMLWESKGDGMRRQYDFTYDRADRLMKAEFIQNDNNAAVWTKSKVNYSFYLGVTSSVLPDRGYDLNGNILRTVMYGSKIGLHVGTAIDILTYEYGFRSNKLLKVTDGATTPASGTLGDFIDGDNEGNDYSYDLNGNLVKDENKGVDTIIYNHLNLVSSIVMKDGKGSITYEYDAEGNKLKKITQQNSVLKDSVLTDITTTTVYNSGNIYVTEVYSDPVLQSKYGFDDLLQLILFEEGRIRLSQKGTTDSSDFQFDYFLKDHLGNIRSVITEEVRTDYYIPATMEEDVAGIENEFYYNLDETRSNKPAGYPATAGTKVAKVGGGSGQPSVGPGKLLRVMAGDRVSMAVSSWWESGVTPTNTGTVSAPLIDLLSLAIPGGSSGKFNPADLTSGILSPAVTTFLTGKNPNTPNKPKAFLNWVLFDEQLNYVADGSGAQVVGANGVMTLLSRTNMSVPQNGYLYIYVSNVSEDVPVYFDDLQVTHERGALLEETHYYPFGLVMHSISSKSFGSLQNCYKFNAGSELNEDFGLDWYETAFRLYDPQIGRFVQSDPLSDFYADWSPYVYALNNPVRYIDPSGLEPENPDDPPEGCEDGTCLPAVVVTPGNAPPSRGGPDAIATLETIAEMVVPGYDLIHVPGNFREGQYLKAAGNIMLGGISFVPGGKVAVTAGKVVVKGVVKAGKWLSKKVGKWFGKKAAKTGTTVLGKYPDYINLASQLNARRFSIPTSVWNKMSPAEQWAANVKFLDRTIARGDKIILSNPVKDINKVGGYLRKELDYLMSKGYKLNSSGTQLIK